MNSHAREKQQPLPATADMFSNPWKVNGAVQAAGSYFVAAVLVTVRSFLDVQDLTYLKSHVASRLKTAAGLVGHSVHTDPGGLRYCLVTMWADRDSRETFTRSVIRQGLVEELGPQADSCLFAAWEQRGADAPPTLAKTFRHFGAPEAS